MPIKHASIDAYVETLSDQGKEVATQMRALIARIVPEAKEAVRYNMPAFQLDGRSFIYFAVWKKHLGLYPIYRGDAAFEELVRPYRAKTDTVQFALDRPLPIDVIEKIILAQAK